MQKKTINTSFWLLFLQNESDIIHLKMNVKLIVLVSNLKHTTWQSHVNIFQWPVNTCPKNVNIEAQEHKALCDPMTEQS